MEGCHRRTSRYNDLVRRASPGRGQGASGGEALNDSVLLVVLDSLRADHTPWHRYDRDTAPSLGRLAERSTVYSCAFAAGPSTISCMKGLLSSTYPLERPDPDSLSGLRRSVPDTFRSAGARTLAVVSNPLLSPGAGWDRGFDDFVGESDLAGDGPSPSRLRRAAAAVRGLPALSRAALRWQRARQLRSGIPPYPTAGSVVDRALSWIRENGDAPFFAWLHIAEPHSPYVPIPKHRECFLRRRVSVRRLARVMADVETRQASLSKEDVELLIDLYDAHIRTADDQLGRLLDGLEELGLLDRLTIVVTADHGEEFREHGEIGHGHMGATPKLYDEIIHVPLLIKLPGSGRPEVKDGLVSHLDIGPTLLEVAGLPPEGMRGRSLLSSAEGDVDAADAAAWSEFEWEEKWVISRRTATEKFIYDERTGSERYDLSRDPLERHNERPGPDVPEDVREHIELLRSSRGGDEQDDVEQDRRTLEKLKDLGYA
ncbi:MAG: sulfatase-like hydrolase/transferase [Candidatus Eisenbacteria bacterium]|nr:sulfatase-like hydrolase/transferase [Candidatus Eisenbacteria bacterium]